MPVHHNTRSHHDGPPTVNFWPLSKFGGATSGIQEVSATSRGQRVNSTTYDSKSSYVRHIQ